MTCTETITITKETHSNQKYEEPKIMEYKVSDEYKPEPLINKITKPNPKPSFLFGYVDI